MMKLTSSILELLGLSLGVEKGYYKDFFMDCGYIMRCNYYPRCPQPELTQGTGQHRDPVAITILRQEAVEGLEVFSDGTWQSVPPVPCSFVVNIGDTFMALSNGLYKSCLHRAVVNRDSDRKSIAFFICPKEEKVIRPHDSLAWPNGKRLYPDFTWSELLDFTQNCRRSDDRTLEFFMESKKN
ncbi:hypothetical protein LUZ60_007729 [Juncus effusus]|nr:hypothetical protein LUZ60_007729 [Juncus effusus]